MEQPKTRSEYLLPFTGETPTGISRQEEALKTAHDIRKFEIELYWKRAGYFWTFIAAALGGYFVLQQKPEHVSFESSYVVTCLGFVFSLAWYFVNRGSKSWQRNWESQVDLLEDEITGPLYKSGVNRYRNRFWDITAGYHFSPTKINHLLGFYITIVWLGLILRTLATTPWWCHTSQILTVVMMTTLTIVISLSFWYQGQTAETDRPIQIFARKREYLDKDPEVLEGIIRF